MVPWRSRRFLRPSRPIPAMARLLAACEPKPCKLSCVTWTRSWACRFPQQSGASFSMESMAQPGGTTGTSKEQPRDNRAWGPPSSTGLSSQCHQRLCPRRVPHNKACLQVSVEGPRQPHGWANPQELMVWSVPGVTAGIPKT